MKLDQEILYGTDNTDAIFEGIKRSVKAVSVTLGPKGDTVIIKRPTGPIKVTKDGVSVVREIFGATDEEDIGCAMIRSVASITDESAGDGTTTASILAYAIIEAGRKMVAAGISPNEIRKGINKAVELAVKYLNDWKIDIAGEQKKIRQVAAISANNDPDLGNLVAEAFEKVDANGIISIQASPTSKSYVEVVDGMRFNRGFIDSQFANNENMTEAVFKEPFILITDGVLTSWEDIGPYAVAASDKKRPLVIIAEDVKDEALNMLIMNVSQGKMEGCAIRAPFTNDAKRDFLIDISIATGAFFFDESRGTSTKAAGKDLKTQQIIDAFGEADRMEINSGTSTIIEGRGDAPVIKKRIDQIQDFLDKNSNDYESDVLRTRLAKMASNVGVIFVGAPSEAERDEIVDRVVDAKRATQAAIEEGYLPGGGVTFIELQEVLYDNEQLRQDCSDEQWAGVEIFRKALSIPLKTMLVNADLEDQVIIHQIRKSKAKYFGMDIRTGKTGNMVKMGIIDPKKVLESIIRNAASIAVLALTSKCSVIIKEKPRGGATLF